MVPIGTQNPTQPMPKATLTRGGLIAGRVSGVLVCFAIVLLALAEAFALHANSLEHVIGSIGSESLYRLSMSDPATVDAIELASALAGIFTLTGGLVTLCAIVSGHISVSAARRAGNLQNRIGTLSLMVAYLCFVSGFLSCCSSANVLLWGLS